MKRIYFLFLSLLMGVMGMVAYAQDKYTLTINVDDTERVGVQLYSYETYSFVDQEVVNGANTYSVAPYSQFRIYAKEGYLLASVTNDTYGYTALSSYAAEYSTSVSSDLSFTVTSVKESDVYTSSFKITVDDPSMVVARLYSNRVITLDKGENVVFYNPETEPQLSIGARGGCPLYKVTDRGVDVAPQGTMYYVTLSEETDLNVTAQWPDDVKFNLNFSFADASMTDVISGISVNGVPVEDFSTEGVQIQGGAQVTLTFNITAYSINALSQNGTTVSLYGSQYSFYMTENTTFGITATKLVPIQFTVNIDDPSNITLYKGYTYENNSVELAAGDNLLEMSSNSSRCVTIVPNSQCYISSISDGNTEYTPSAYGTTVPVSEGTKITIRTGKIVRDKVAKIIVTGRELADSYFSFYSTVDNSMRFDFSEGENQLNFCDADLPFSFGCYGNSIGTDNKIFVNGLRAHKYYGSYALNFDNDATICIDLNNSNASLEKTVSFVLGENVEKNMISLVETPLGIAYEWDTIGLTSIDNNSYDVTITPATGAPINIYLDGKAVTANAEGKYVVSITPESAVINITNSESDGIIEINNTDRLSDGKIYTLSGIQVKKASKGLYIINGKKYIAK
ncbi:MAG: hypothetical protein ACI4B5_05235 [Bacteroidaceae bacterium]